MEKQRRIAKGTMSEIIGEKAIPIDKFSRMIGYHNEAAEAKKLLSREDIESA